MEGVDSPRDFQEVRPNPSVPEHWFLPELEGSGCAAFQRKGGIAEVNADCTVTHPYYTGLFTSMLLIFPPPWGFH